jgi:hypothetical protein
VPLTAAGKLNIVASSDLGGLGARDGTPVEFSWALPGIAPLLLPWLAVLGLLALKPNRHAAAWLIWLPLGCVAAVTVIPPLILPSGANFLLDVTAALAIGLAAVWLLSGYLRRSHRVLTFFGLLLTLAGFSVLAAAAKQGLNLFNDASLEVGLVLAFAVPANALAVSLCGLLCRGRYQPIRLYGWLVLVLAGIWLVITVPFFLVATAGSSGSIPWSEFLIPVLAVAAANFVLLLPFLILSSASPFYRERLKALLNVRPAAPPPLSAPPSLKPI